MGLGAHTLYELYGKNDPDVIAKFLLCCWDRRSEWIHSKSRVPDLAINNTTDMNPHHDMHVDT